MIVTAIKTKLVGIKQDTLQQLLDQSLTELKEGSVVAITSKIVSLCEGRVIPIDDIDKEELIHKEADYFLPIDFGQYGFHFTITRKTLISMAGIDQSNGDDNYVLWPANPQRTANEVRKYLCDRFNLKHVGVIITDSTCMPPMRSGTVGILLAHSGFLAVDSHIGKPDLFGRPFHFSKSGVGSGLAATANVAMGEATEQTPIVVMEDLPMVNFQDRDPTPEELEDIYISPEEDLYAPFIYQAKWEKGGGGASSTLTD